VASENRVQLPFTSGEAALGSIIEAVARFVLPVRVSCLLAVGVIAAGGGAARGADQPWEKLPNGVLARSLTSRAPAA